MVHARLYVYLEVLLWWVVTATIVVPLVGCFLAFWPPSSVSDQKATFLSISHPHFIFYKIVPLGNARFYVYLEVLLW